MRVQDAGDTSDHVVCVSGFATLHSTCFSKGVVHASLELAFRLIVCVPCLLAGLTGDGRCSSLISDRIRGLLAPVFTAIAGTAVALQPFFRVPWRCMLHGLTVQQSASIIAALRCTALPQMVYTNCKLVAGHMNLAGVTPVIVRMGVAPRQPWGAACLWAQCCLQVCWDLPCTALLSHLSRKQRRRRTWLP